MIREEVKTFLSVFDLGFFGCMVLVLWVDLLQGGCGTLHTAPLAGAHSKVNDAYGDEMVSKWSLNLLYHAF